MLVNSGVFSAFKPDHLWMKLPWRKGISGVSFVEGDVRILFHREKKSLINCTFLRSFNLLAGNATAEVKARGQYNKENPRPTSVTLWHSLGV